MKMSPRNQSRLGIRRTFGVIVLAFLLVSITPISVLADCCGVDATIAANTSSTLPSWITELANTGGILSGITSLLTFMSGAFTQLTGNGFSAVTAAITGTTMTHASAIYNLGDFTSQTNRYNNQIAQTAQQQMDSTMPDQTAACQWQAVWQAKDQVDRSIAWLAAAHGTLQSGDCRGGLANCTGPGRPWEQFNDICQLGFVNTAEYGYTNLGCADATSVSDASYKNRDENIDAGLAALQMPLPPQVCILKDGYVSFSGPPAGASCASGSGSSPAALYNADPTQSALAWIGFYKACENLDSDDDIPPVYSTGAATTNDIAKIMAGRKLSMTKNSRKAQCMQALWERTACPSSSGSAAQALGVGGNCSQLQLTLCQKLMNDPNPLGIADPSGGKTGGTPTFADDTSGVGINGDQYLQNCVNSGAGLSKLMAEKIIAYRCGDMNYLSNGAANRAKDTHQLDRDTDFPCQEARDRFDNQLKEEQARLSELLRNSQRTSYTPTTTGGAN